MLGVIVLARCVTWASTFLPPFTLSTLQGTITDSELKDNVVMTFVLPSSPACETILGYLQAESVAYPDFQFILVTYEDSNALRGLLSTTGTSFQVLIDSDMLLASLFQVFRAPTVCTVSKGVLVDRLDWPLTEGTLADALDYLEAGAAISWPSGPERMLEKAAPQFNGSRDDGLSVSLFDVHQPFLLAFTSTDCPLCHAMQPELSGISTGFPVLQVVVGELDTTATQETQEGDLLMRIYDANWQIAELYNVRTVPTLFLIDACNVIVWINEGYLEGLAVVTKALAREVCGHERND